MRLVEGSPSVCICVFVPRHVAACRPKWTVSRQTAHFAALMFSPTVKRCGMLWCIRSFTRRPYSTTGQTDERERERRRREGERGRRRESREREERGREREERQRGERERERERETEEREREREREERERGQREREIVSVGYYVLWASQCEWCQPISLK